MNAAHPLARLTAAESTLVASIDAASARLDAVGSSAVESAINCLRVAAHAASARLADTGAIVASIVGDVLECVLGEALGLQTAMGREEPPVVAPAQVSPFAGYAHDEPSPEVQPEHPTTNRLPDRGRFPRDRW